MPNVVLEERVIRLEELMAEVWRAFEYTDQRLDRRFEETDRRLDQRFEETDRRLDQRFEETDRRLDQRSAEIDRRFEHTAREIDRLSQEMRLFREEMRASTKELNKKWGELSNKMGTMAEDLVAPSIPRILQSTVGCPDVEMMAVCLRRRHPVQPGRSQEYDVVAMCGEYVLINETKSSLNTKDIDDFVQVLSEAREFFPEYAARSFIGAIASLYVDDSVVRYGQRQGVLVLGFGEGIMDILNEPGFIPRRF
jgi:hypothetical protein